MTYEEYISIIISRKPVYLQVIGTSIVLKMISSNELYNNISITLSNHKYYSLDELEISNKKEMVGSKKISKQGFRGYIKKRMPEEWIYALKNQKVYIAYVNILYEDINRYSNIFLLSTNIRNARFARINKLFEYTNYNYPVGILSPIAFDEFKKLKVNYCQIIDDVDNYRENVR
jgi:hypothetical protein